MSIQHPPAKLIAAVMGLSSFVAAVGAGWLAGNPASLILFRGLICMGLGYLIGRVLGWVAETTAKDYFEDYKQRHPIPEQLSAAELEEAVVES